MAWTDEIKARRESSDNSEKQYKENRRITFKRLTPMVKKLLEELGEALYGSNFLFSKKYVVEVNANTEGWGVGKNENGYINDYDTRVWVTLWPAYDSKGHHEVDRFCFKLYFNGNSSEFITETTSEHDLKNALLRM